MFLQGEKDEGYLEVGGKDVSLVEDTLALQLDWHAEGAQTCAHKMHEYFLGKVLSLQIVPLSPPHNTDV